MLLCRCWCLARWFYHQESSKFKGVVSQPNGRWGAQIYEKHQRVWLGTFNEEEEAASSYDIAARRFRGRDAVTNFKSVAIDRNDAAESAFLDAHSKSEIVDMLRKHTYADEFRQSKRKFVNGDGKSGTALIQSNGNDAVSRACDGVRFFSRKPLPPVT
ncbi:unnamed protein product [Cochlearia groenlandica]